MADLSAVAYDALKTAVEHVLGKIREGEKLSTEDIFVLYLGTIVEELREVRKELARLDANVDETNRRIDETNKRIDTLVLEFQKRVDSLTLEIQRQFGEANKRIDALVLEFQRQFAEVHKRIDETNKRIDGIQITLLEMQKLLMELVMKVS